LEDDVMRVFGSDRIKGLMGRLGIPEDQPIENRMLSKAIESAQSKIEGFNFDARKHLLEYDDVLNHQRKIIYDRRKKILYGENDFVLEELKSIFASEPASPAGGTEKIETLEKRRAELGDDKFFHSQRMLMLQAVDMLWVEHLEAMDYMRSSVRLRAYGQKDPLVEYKNEGRGLFVRMEASIDNAIAEMALKVGGQMNEPKQEPILEIHNSGPMIGSVSANLVSSGASSSNPPTGGRVGRNDPCPCGSGKKYKKCHWA